MQARTPEKLLAEIRDLMRERMPTVRARVTGMQLFLNTTFATDEDREHSAAVWILRAHVGTLDKLAGLFTRDGAYEAFELLAIARNLFENLVWLRLFGVNQQYGLIFYDQLLTQQKQNTERMIAKIEGEIELFEAHDKLDSQNLGAAFDPILNGENPTPEEIEQAQEKHRALCAELDMRARRSFALYSAEAQFNGYGFQCHLLRERVVPKYRATLERVQVDIDRLQTRKSALLSPAMLGRSNARWNWKDRAGDVGMRAQYDFLYSYTSKLLHATPMNLITEKALSSSETLAMLDYAFVAISDLLEEIERFIIPGQVNLLVLNF